MKQLRISILVMLLFMVGSSIALAAPTAKITVKVLDETGTPLKDANVKIAYQVTREKGKLGLKGVSVKGQSDKSGLFSASNSDAVPRVTISVRKDGYYKSGQIVRFTSESRLLNRWEPWNPIIDVILKRKRNPVAMYAKNTSWIKVPILNKPVGYDLEKGDWVAPYGKGVMGDLLVNFYWKKRSYTDYDANMTISFSNVKDGIQEFYFDVQEQSYYKWPFEAPESGYIQSINLYEESTSDNYKTNKKKNVNS